MYMTLYHANSVKCLIMQFLIISVSGMLLLHIIIIAECISRIYNNYTMYRILYIFGDILPHVGVYNTVATCRCADIDDMIS